MARGRTSTNAVSRTPKRTRKAKSDKPAVIAEAGHNSGPRDLTEQERDILCQHWLGKIARQQDIVATAVSGLRNLYKGAKVEGFLKREIDLQIKMEGDEGPELLREEALLLNRVARRRGLGEQLDLFEATDRTPLEDKAYADGLRAGARGDDPHSPYDGVPMQKWMKGWNEAQAIIRERYLETPLDRAIARTDDVIDDDEFERAEPDSVAH